MGARAEIFVAFLTTFTVSAKPDRLRPLAKTAYRLEMQSQHLLVD